MLGNAQAFFSSLPTRTILSFGPRRTDRRGSAGLDRGRAARDRRL